MAEKTAVLDERNRNRVRFAVRADRTKGPTPGVRWSPSDSRLRRLPKSESRKWGQGGAGVNMQSKAGMSFRNSKMNFERVLFPFGKRRKSRDRSQKTGAR